MFSVVTNFLRIGVVSLIAFFPTVLVFAQGSPCEGAFCNPLSFDTLSEFLIAILNVVILIAFPIIVLFLIYAGFLFVSAQGNEEKIKLAKRIFLWTVIGALLILGASALSLAIKGTVEDIKKATFETDVESTVIALKQGP